MQIKYGKIICGGLLCLALSGCLMQAPEINYKDNEITLNGLQSVHVKFNFNLRNPNSLPLSGKLKYTFFVADKEFFSGQSDTLNAPANGELEFSLQQELALEKIFGSVTELFNAMAGGQKTVRIRISGEYRTAVLGFLEWPAKLEHTEDVPLPELSPQETFQQNTQEELQKQIEQGLKDLQKLLQQ